MMFPTVAILALALQVRAAEYTLYHRYLDGSDFETRGVVNIDDTRIAFTSASEPSSSYSGADWYQVALDVGDQKLTTSTRACFASSPAILTVHLSNGKPTDIEYKPLPASASGECPNTTSTTKAKGDGSNDGPTIEIVAKSADVAESPSLAEPVVVDQTGQEVKPPPEKTFLQKYWFGIVVAMLFIAFNIGEDPQAQQGGAARSGGAAGGR